MEKSTLYGVGIFVLIILGGLFFIKGGQTNGSVVANPIDGQVIQGQLQKIVLSQEGFNYKDAGAKAGKPISISADSSVRGCLRSVAFNINGQKYVKYLKTPEESLELPALSRGSYTFSCSMGMGYGKLIVE